MKKKSLILTTAFAMALGVGVAVGAHQSKAGVKEAEADGEITLYCKMEQSWWKADGAAVGAHYWGGTDGTSWPGVRMTAVAGETDLWSVKLPADNKNIVFVRVPGSGDIADWGAQTDDLTIPTDGKNMFTITSNTPTWSGESKKCVGEWSVYTPSEPEPEKDDPSTEKNVFYVWDKDKLLGTDLSKINVYGFGQDSSIKEMTWPGVHSNDYASVSDFTLGEEKVYKVELSVSYPQFILNDGEHQTDDITLDGHAGEVLLPSSTESSWQSASDFTNPPASNGYYILGDKTSSWTFTGATKLGEGDEDNLAVLTNFAVTKDNQYKIKSYFDKVTAWFNFHGGEEKTSFNYVAPDSNPKNIYLSKDGTFYVTDYIEPDVPENDGYYLTSSKNEFKYAGAAVMSTTGLSDGNCAELFNYSAAKDEAIRVRGYYAGQDPEKKEGEYGGEAIAGVGAPGEGGTFVMSDAKSIDVFAKWIKVSEEPEAWTLKFYVREHKESYDVTFKGFFFEGKNQEKVIDVVDTQRATEDEVFDVDKEALAQEGYVLRGVYTDDKFEHEYSASKLSEATELYAKYTKLRYYLTGDDTFSGEGMGWNVDAATPIGPQGLDRLVGTVTVPNTVDADHPMKVKPLEYVGQNELDHSDWKPETYTLGEEKAFVIIDGDGNFSFTVPGNYAFYVNSENKVYFNNNEYVFYARFLNEMELVCDDGGETNIDALKAKWAEMSIAYNAVSAEERTALEKNYNINSGDEHSEDAKLRMIAKYAYIVMKYGTDNCPDFIWGKNYGGRIGNAMPELSTDSNVMLIVIISISAVSVASLGALLILKKKKRK